MAMTIDAHNEDWPLRAWLLAAAGVAVGLAVYFLTRGESRWQPTEDSVRLAAATFLVIGGLALAYTVERGRVASSFAFATVAGLVVASIVYWNGTPGKWSSEEPWRLLCGLLTVALAAPLFSAWRDTGSGRAIAYPAAHNRAWTNVVLWFASWAFVGVVWLLAFLLGQLFGLIGLQWLNDLLREQWFGMMLTGGATGAAIGLLRDSETIIGTLRRVVTTVLGVLGPVLAGGLALFLIALPFTGLSPLWEATRSTTPVLLACVIGALILSNAILGDSDADERRNPALRWGAMALGLAILPLGAIAAFSTGLRIGQYGLSPDRLWAVVFTGIACAYGIAYLVALARGRMGWAGFVRPANLMLGIGLCAVAFLLSTPVLSFGAISTRDQIARLADGRTKPEKFDWRALRWDFGPSGKAALAQLAKTGATPAIRTAAANSLKSENRYDSLEVETVSVPLEERITILPKPVPIPETLRTQLESEGCRKGGPVCRLLYTPGATEAILVHPANVRTWRLVNGKWQNPEAFSEPRAYERNQDGLMKGPVEVKTVTRRQVFANGRPIGDPFE
jgi:Domain of unknown function (DUF4153)